MADEEIPEEEETTPPPRQVCHKPPKSPCANQRIDELATPPRRMFLALWTDHGYHLPKDKVKNLKLLLQKLYAMTPEETAQYFAELRCEAKAAAMRRKLKQKLRKYLETKQQKKQKGRAYKLLGRLLKCGMSYAAQNPIPSVVSIRLRYLSDIILEQLCTLRMVEIPDRANPNKQGQFLISVADWMGIAVERLYFAAQTTIQQLTLESRTVVDEEMNPFEDLRPCQPSSTPQRHSLNSQHQTMGVPKTYSGMGDPAASSTPKRHSLNSQNRTVQAPRTYSEMGQPMGSSTPQKRSLDPQNDTATPDFTQLDAEFTPEDIALYPYYSILESKEPPGKKPPKEDELVLIPQRQVFHYKQPLMPPCKNSKKKDQSKTCPKWYPYGRPPASSDDSFPDTRRRRTCQTPGVETFRSRYYNDYK